LLGGFTHLGAGALLAAVARRLTHGESGQRVGLIETLAEVVHALEQVLQTLDKIGLASGQVAQLSLLFGRERLGRLAHEIGFGGRLCGLLHRLLLLLQQGLSVLDHAAVGLELAKALEHLLKLVRNGLLVGLGLRQRSPGNILRRTRLLRLRLGPGLGLLLIGLALALFARWLGRRLVLAALRLVGGWFRRFVLGSGRA